MKMVIGHNAAVDYWRTHDLEETSLSNATSLRDSASTWSQVDEVNLYRLGFDTSFVELLTVPRNSGHKGDRFSCASWEGALPRHALREVMPGILVASPEFCFVLMASRLSLLQLIAYGMELCGIYALRTANGTATRYDRKPLTTVRKLTQFVGRCEGHGGVKAARRALQYVLDGSASPMETACEMMVCLPFKLGGYGLPKPLMNGGVSLSAKARAMARKRENRCDLYWPEHNLAFEYDSEYSHGTSRLRAADVKRSNILEFDGKTVVTATWWSVDDVAEFENLMVMLAKHMKLKLRVRVDRRDFNRRIDQLRSVVLPPVEHPDYVRDKGLA